MTLKAARDRDYGDRVKVELDWRDEAKREGYDPALVADPIFVRDDVQRITQNLLKRCGA